MISYERSILLALQLENTIYYIVFYYNFWGGFTPKRVTNVRKIDVQYEGQNSSESYI